LVKKKPIIFFDGICHLCNAFVDKVTQLDHKSQFQFAPLQGETAKKSLTLEERTQLETIILFENEHKYLRSDAVLRILTRLGGFYRIFTLGYLLPRFLRDSFYAWMARHRYAWFGQREFCRLPQPHEKERFLP
jgi:predicted DCC family thiol-disulfide oxidoreductase YuxK